MKIAFLSLTILLTEVALAAKRTYPGDIVAYWNERVENVLNNETPRLSSLRESYTGGLIHTSILAAADDSEGESRAVRQLAISFAAHDTLVRTFTAQYRAIDGYVRTIEDAVEVSAREAAKARAIGERAAFRVYLSRAGDGVDKYFRYEWQSPAPGVYQPTPPSNNLPADPNSKFQRPFGGIKTITPWKAPPNPRSKPYVAYVQQIKDKGAKVGSKRTPEETEIGYYWLESSQTWWNRFARTILADRFVDDISGAAKFYALLNWAIANAGIQGFATKEKWNSWRPETALHYKEKYLYGGKVIYDPSWQPVVPTPSHQDYLSGHSVYGGSAAEILRRFLKSDKLPKPISITVNTTADNVGLQTRTFTTLSGAAKENGDSRVFVGVHFQFASDEGIKASTEIAGKTWEKGTKNYL